MPASLPLVWFSAALAGFAVAATLTTWVAPVLRRRGAVVRPGPEGRGRAVPRGGGLAIVAVAAASGLVAAWAFPESHRLVAAWLLPALVVAAVSLRDDFSPLPAVLRFAVHIAAAAATVAVAGPIRAMSVGGVAAPDLGVLAWPVTILWLVGMTNAFNFMDGIDGIAGITAAAAGGSLAFAAGAAGCEPVAIVALALASGSLGFLTSNWPPARVFMGDVGSTFCGFTIAAVPLLVGPVKRPTILAVAVLAVWPFLCDAGFTFLKRVVRRENVLEPHQGHLYQRLVIAGWSHRAVSGLYGLLAAICGSIAAAALLAPPLRPTTDALVAGALMLVPVLLLTLTQVSEARTASPHSAAPE
jgi:UDP-N-acetylmuramyl pentapeptide phosphotransferase/UDP-N-acetylglucosamine-1-phosphate transferase